MEKIKVLFICHGNICRSPMAEFILKDIIKKRGLEDKFIISSSATSTEEIGNPVHPGTRKKLSSFNINTSGKKAVQITKSDYEKYDYIFLMDNNNIRNIKRIIDSDPDNKICRFLDITNNPRDIADPWYTGNFDETYNDILEGCTAFIEKLESENII